MAGAFFDLTVALNILLNYFCAGSVLLALFLGVIKYSSETFKKQGFSQGVYLSFVLILEIIIAALILWAIPIPFVKFIRYTETAFIVRWITVSAIIILYFRLRKHSEKRGLFTAGYHIAILSIGWFINSWVGVFIFSLPLLAIFYYALHCIALIIIPASDPENREEKLRRFMVFLSYVWGLQMPLWNVSTANAKEAEKKIDGKPILLFPFPGLIRTDPHQVVGIKNGINFRVEGPGVIFTNKGDDPFQVIDLRNQTLSSTIHTFSREGIPFLAEVSVTFVIDRDDWNPSLFHQLGRVNPFLRTGKELDRNLGRAFPYSKARVEAALRLRSTRSQADGKIERWDDHVLALAEKAAREILAERSVKDLWQARENENCSASEEITNSIKLLIEKPLREKGVRLLNIRTSGFKFTDKKDREENSDEVIEQQIATWSVERKRELDIALADAQAEAERIEEEARVYARTTLLTAIMEGLEQARVYHPNRNQDAVAQVYLDALKNMIEQQSDLKYTSEARSELQKYKDYYYSNSQKR